MSDSMPTATAGGKVDGQTTTGERLLSIGQLVATLQEEFPGLSISKVRYLEDRGLLSPQRTRGKYRKYSKNDMRTLRSILVMQRDEYLPLDIIRRRVESAVAGSPVAGFAQTAESIMALRRQEAAYTLEEFCQELGATQDYVLGLVESRLVDMVSDSGPSFTEGDLETARICLRLDHYHVEPRHLRMLSSAAEREAGLIEQIATPDLRSGHVDRRDFGLQTAQELAGLFHQLTRLLLLRELRHVL